nr:hypothetical protein [Candidatus Mycoplasma haematolamae]
MKPLSLSDKKSILAGATTRKKSATTTVKKVPTEPNPWTKWNNAGFNLALVGTAIVPGIVELFDNIYQLCKLGVSGPKKGGYYSGAPKGSYMDQKRDYFAYASEAYRPTIRFGRNLYSSSISFGMPWFV